MCAVFNNERIGFILLTRSRPPLGQHSLGNLSGVVTFQTEKEDVGEVGKTEEVGTIDEFVISLTRDRAHDVTPPAA